MIERIEQRLWAWLLPIKGIYFLGGWWPGELEHFTIWSVALTDEQIAELVKID